jgi:hypothetical protein
MAEWPAGFLKLKRMTELERQIEELTKQLQELR